MAIRQYRVVQSLRVGVFKVCGRGVETGIFAGQRRDALVDAIGVSGQARKDDDGWSINFSTGQHITIAACSSCHKDALVLEQCCWRATHGVIHQSSTERLPEGCIGE